ncbi:Cupredoxin [Podospora fimiseda]|uniref:Cupredoxin n=1 Tax=Podospora fimiseda TaxID=252190 RepID=A0AAN7BHV9_9PEZI|nr:Cupredoxin [Podospora fimiseda]
MAHHSLSIFFLLLAILQISTAVPTHDHVKILQARRKPNLSPPYPFKFQFPLPIPPLKQPKAIFTNNRTGGPINYYEIEIKPFNHSIYPNLPPTPMVGYDGISPGPTIMLPRGTESVIRFVNNSPSNSSIHLHGSYSRAPWDGWAEDMTSPGQYKDYFFPNRQSARMMWYHDHAMHITAENAYMGQAGVYLLTDPAEEALNLPSGYGTYDIPLVLTSKQYNSNGTLYSTHNENLSLWGDIIHVNGQPWPFHSVQPRKYRFRFLNAAVSRSFGLYFVKTTATNDKLPFKAIASDSGLLSHPVQISDISISMAERYEIVFDFSGMQGQTIELRNFYKAGGAGTEDDYMDTHQVMQFKVSSLPLNTPNNSSVPNSLRTVPFPTSTNDKISQKFKFRFTKGKWLINGVGFADAANRILANVPKGTVQIWELENMSDSWSHPIHVHLVDFKIISRRKGARGIMSYEKAGLKDVVWLGKYEKVLVEAHFAPWDGVYMFHCHNLIHEDSDMMAAFNVTETLSGLGYQEKKKFDFGFDDPMENRWRAKEFVMEEYINGKGKFGIEQVERVVKGFVRANPYGDVYNITPP